MAQSDNANKQWNNTHRSYCSYSKMALGSLVYSHRASTVKRTINAVVLGSKPRPLT